MRAKLTAFFLKLGEEKSSLVPVLRREEVTLMQRVMFGVSQINYTREFSRHLWIEFTFDGVYFVFQGTELAHSRGLLSLG